MNKILTISIAAYNVEKYIKETLETLLIDDIEDLEILVEDDGGRDNTAKIVKEYEKKYPGIVKLVHKKNGGYGSTINKSIELAQGKYFKQLDGDDFFDKENFKDFLNVLRSTNADSIYTPYVEYYEEKKIIKKIDFFQDDINGEQNLDNVLSSAIKKIDMHMLTYKTQILRENKINLIEKCFYTDTEYALYPLLYCKDMYIFHKSLYMYRLGLGGQSVSIEGRRKHYKDHEKVSKRLLEFFDINKEQMAKNQYEYFYETICTHVTATVCNFFMVVKPSRNIKKQLINFENLIKSKNQDLYKEMAKKRKAIYLLRKSNYILYFFLVIKQIRKVKKWRS